MPGDEISFDRSKFSGQARLFPLPNLVLFPHVIQPLHIFEPRYRAMLEEALASDKLIAMAALAPGWEADYEGRPPIEPIGCLGLVATHFRLEEGKYNILLLGLHRLRIVRELQPAKLFREAQVEIVDDVYRSEGVAARANLHGDLLAAFKRALARLPELHQQLDHLLGGDLPLGMLTDIVGHTLTLPAAVKLRLLSEPDVETRARLLLESFPAAAEPSSGNEADSAARKYPPDFSVN